MDDIVALCRRRGFIWQSSEIYGGINGFWDYGPLGALLKKNLKDAWFNDIVTSPPDGPDGHPLSIVPVDTTIIMNPRVWEASGHVAGFNDPMVDDKETQQRFRADHLVGLFLLPEGPHSPGPDRPRLEEGESLFLAAAIIGGSLEEASGFVAENPGNVRLDPSFGIKKLKKVEVGERIPDPRGTQINLQVHDPAGRTHVAVMREISVQELTSAHRSIPSPYTGQAGTLTAPRQFNLMFTTFIGALQDEDAKAYLRPETAQGIFTQFWNVVDTSRVKVPFGIAQTGKAFRNEVTPRNFTFRSREFEQMEIEFFIPDPEVVGEDVAQAQQWYAYWRDMRYNWWQGVGLAGDNLILREHDRDELAHYAKEGAGTSDIEYRFPFTAPGFGELEGVAHRTNFDLRQHAEACGQGDKLRYFDQERNVRYFPHVIEPSAGADRGTLALLCEAYTPDDSRPSKVYMKFTPRMAPIKAAVFPLVNKDGMPEKAEALYRELRKRWSVQFDVKQSIGKRYARMDEAGTPYCFTIDGQTLEDQTVTVRERDTQAQERIGIDKVEAYLADRIG
ncbi:MAG: glycine--tRNA ligase [Phycisphaeraceae bacterium]